MTLTTIYVVRHGFRSNWTTDHVTGETTSNVKSPTNIAADPALSAYGVTQAEQLATQATSLLPKILRVYTSPFYRCIQTVQPLWKRLQTTPLICDRGLGEWYGMTVLPFHLSALPAISRRLPVRLEQFKVEDKLSIFWVADSTIKTMFPGLEERTSTIPNPNGESIDDLHDRCAYTLASIIAHVDQISPTEDKHSIVICSHAASIIAIGRALTGDMPTNPFFKDFDTYTCSISRFERSSTNSSEVPVQNAGAELPTILWRNGQGVGGGWSCEANADVSHLLNGGERNWHFSGDESFIDEIACVRSPMESGAREDVTSGFKMTMKERAVDAPSLRATDRQIPDLWSSA